MQCAGTSQNGFFFPFSARSTMRFSLTFTVSTCSSSWRYTHRSVMLSPLEFLTLILVHTEATAICHLQSGFLHQYCLFPMVISTVSLCSGKPGLLVFACLSNFGSSGLPSVLSCLMDPRRAVDFSVYSTFNLLLG